MTWLSFHEAAREIEGKLGVSPGKAQSILRQLCASGEVRSQKEPYVIVGHEPQRQAPPQRIEPSEWRQREIDLMTDQDDCRYFVDVDKADFRYWLDHQEQDKPGRGKRPRIKALLAEIFEGRKVPDPAHRPRKFLKAEVVELDPSLAPLDEATLKLAIDEYNADPKRSYRHHSD